MRPAPTVSMPTSTSTTSPAAPPPAAAALPASPWHSPVPYLFGGLAAMLGLITLALLILACSYWKLNSYLGTGDADANAATTTTSGPGTTGGNGAKSPAASSPATFADLVAVVMAGEKMPTFLAAPIVRRAHGDSAVATAVTGEGSPDTEEEQESRDKAAGEGESGVVADAERERQLDQV